MRTLTAADVPILVVPGEYVADELVARGLSPADLARAIQLSEEQIAGVLDGSAEIGLEEANKLAEFFGTSAQIWLNLEAQYREALLEGKPSSVTEASGRLVLRLPKTLHQAARELAERDGVSLNQELLSLIAFGIGRATSAGGLSVSEVPGASRT